MAIWTGFEATAPLLGLPHAEGGRFSERLALAAGHALYGFVLDETRASSVGLTGKVYAFKTLNT